MPDDRVIGAIGRHRQAWRAAREGTRDAEYVIEVDGFVELSCGDPLAGPNLPFVTRFRLVEPTRFGQGCSISGCAAVRRELLDGQAGAIVPGFVLQALATYNTAWYLPQFGDALRALADRLDVTAEVGMIPPPPRFDRQHFSRQYRRSGRLRPGPTAHLPFSLTRARLLRLARTAGDGERRHYLRPTRGLHRCHTGTARRAFREAERNTARTFRRCGEQNILHHVSHPSTHPICVAEHPAMDERLREAAIGSWRTGRCVPWWLCG